MRDRVAKERRPCVYTWRVAWHTTTGQLHHTKDTMQKQLCITLVLLHRHTDQVGMISVVLAHLDFHCGETPPPPGLHV